jgi:hypothetical protein
MQDGSNFQFVYDDVAALHAGLEAKIGNPSPNVFTQMEWEHTMGPLAHVQFNYGTDNAFTTTAQKEWEIAVNGSEHAFAHREEWLSKERFAEERNQSRSEWLGGRQLVRPLARVISENPGMMKGAGEDPEEGVVDVEALGGVLYSGPMFLWYNNILRFVGDTSDGYRPDIVKGHKLEGEFVTTTHAINSCILVQSKQQVACKVYRGVKGGMLPRNFWIPNKFGVKGGIERGFSSFTTKKNMALGFSKADGPSQSSMLFEAQMGMVDRGADLSWLSQYPGEAEILFAPLTGMEVIGDPARSLTAGTREHAGARRYTPAHAGTRVCLRVPVDRVPARAAPGRGQAGLLREAPQCTTAPFVVIKCQDTSVCGQLSHQPLSRHPCCALGGKGGENGCRRRHTQPPRRR